MYRLCQNLKKLIELSQLLNHLLKKALQSYIFAVTIRNINYLNYHDS